MFSGGNKNGLRVVGCVVEGVFCSKSILFEECFFGI